MKLSIVIPTFGRPADLIRCLTAIGAQSRAPDQLLVAVRDDDPDTREAIARFEGGALPLEVVSAGRSDASEARNRCLARATGDVIVLTDDDTLPRPGWLAAIHERYRDEPRLGALGGPDWPDGREQPVERRPAVVGAVQWWGRRIGNHHRGTNGSRDVEWLKGANMSLRREALSGLRFGRLLRGRGAQFGEDVAVSLQIRRAGWLVRYDPAVAVDHFAGRLPAQIDHRRLADPESLFDAGHNDTVMMLEYLPAVRRVVFMLWGLLVGTRLLPGLLAALHLGLTRNDWSGWRRSGIVRRGRFDGWRQWRRERSVAASPARPPAAGEVDPSRPSVCLVTHVVSPWDGQGRVVHRLARHLAERGVAVTLVASEVDPGLREVPGISWIRIGVWRRLPHTVKWILFALLVPVKLPRRVRRTFDIVHLNGAIAPIRADVNTAHFVHGSWRKVGAAVGGRAKVGWYQRVVAAACAWAEARAFRSAGVVVAVSDGVRRGLETDAQVDPGRIRIIYNGVDSNEFRPRGHRERRRLREELNVPASAFLTVFVGDAKSARKNLELALESLSRLPERFRLAIVGEFRGGPYPRMAERLGVASRTWFLGVRHDVASCLRDADLVFCASRYEPASLVLLEAMASGVPVVTCPEVGNAVFIDSGRNGFLIDSADDLEGATWVARVLELDPSLKAQIGMAAREAALELSWNRMGDRYRELYQTVLARAAVPADGPDLESMMWPRLQEKS